MESLGTLIGKISVDNWVRPDIVGAKLCGDMPGDKVEINEGHMDKADIIFIQLLRLMAEMFGGGESCRAVIAVCGGSGVGKSEIASLLSYYFQQAGIQGYTLSGDNYPRRIPKYNDAERLRIFRESAIRGMVAENCFTPERFEVIRREQLQNTDADPASITQHPWYESYIRNGRDGLGKYLGSTDEINFSDIGQIIASFKRGERTIWLKRMGRTESDLWFESVDFTETQILIIEWTHGNSGNYQGVDIPILLNSTPEETLAHRRARNRDGATDSPFTAMVLALEQEMLVKQAHKAKIIVSKNGKLLTYGQYREIMKDNAIDNGPMLNAYPDSMGGTLGDIAGFLSKPEIRGVFRSFYILPSIFHSDLDRGFSVIDYSLEETLASEEDLTAIRALGIDLKLDFVLNHASVNSPQFKDILEKGSDSAYKDFFIDWNRFWENCGAMTEEGYIRPSEEHIRHMFFRKPELPLLMVRFPDGRNVPYWNTFYQDVTYDSGSRPSYLGQMDLNIDSPMVWDFYDDTLRRLSGYGAKIVRLDAFAYTSKKPGARNFLNEPETWDLLERVRKLAGKYGLQLLPEIHAGYEEKIYEKISSKGYMVYDFFLPGLIIDAIEHRSGETLISWAQEIIEKNIKNVNMLGCHDGIPLLDLRGLIPEERIQKLIEITVSRGGHVKDLHGLKNMYYQVNATYFSALGEDIRKMLLARAIQMFMPGKPQVWYLDLFLGKNDLDAVKRAGGSGHKEINRTNLTLAQIEQGLNNEAVKKQLEMLRFRASFPAFAHGSKVSAGGRDGIVSIAWEKDGYQAKLDADFESCRYNITATDPNGNGMFTIEL